MKGRKYLGVILALFLCMFCTNLVQASHYPYELEVNLSKNVVTVYGQDKDGRYVVPKKAFVCSSGNDTPTGTFRTSDKYLWREMFGGVYAQYATRITGHILFHSVSYLKNNAKNTLDYNAYNQLGKTVSMGCIRLTVEDAKWIYDNCPAGTTVRIVRKGTVPMIPKAPQKIDPEDAARRGWDPTDPDEKNPWSLMKSSTKKHNLSEKNPIVPVGKKEIIGIESNTCVGTVEVLCAEGSYYMRAEDVTVVWGSAGKKLIFPKILPTDKKFYDMALVSYEENQLLVDYYMCDDVPYYKIRDLARLTQHQIIWKPDINKMFVFALHTEPTYNVEQGKI